MEQASVTGLARCLRLLSRSHSWVSDYRVTPGEACLPLLHRGDQEARQPGMLERRVKEEQTGPEREQGPPRHPSLSPTPAFTEPTCCTKENFPELSHTGGNTPSDSRGWGRAPTDSPRLRPSFQTAQPYVNKALVFFD